MVGGLEMEASQSGMPQTKKKCIRRSSTPKKNFRHFIDEQKHIISTKYPFLTNQQIENKAKTLWHQLSKGKKKHHEQKTARSQISGSSSVNPKISWLKSPVKHVHESPPSNVPRDGTADNASQESLPYSPHIRPAELGWKTYSNGVSWSHQSYTPPQMVETLPGPPVNGILASTTGYGKKEKGRVSFSLGQYNVATSYTPKCILANVDIHTSKSKGESVYDISDSESDLDQLQGPSFYAMKYKESLGKTKKQKSLTAQKPAQSDPANGKPVSMLDHTLSDSDLDLEAQLLSSSILEDEENITDEDRLTRNAKNMATNNKEMIASMWQKSAPTRDCTLSDSDIDLEAQLHNREMIASMWQKSAPTLDCTVSDSDIDLEAQLLSIHSSSILEDEESITDEDRRKTKAKNLTHMATNVKEMIDSMRRKSGPTLDRTLSDSDVDREAQLLSIHGNSILEDDEDITDEDRLTTKANNMADMATNDRELIAPKRRKSAPTMDHTLSDSDDDREAQLLSIQGNSILEDDEDITDEDRLITKAKNVSYMAANSKDFIASKIRKSAPTLDRTLSDSDVDRDAQLLSIQGNSILEDDEDITDEDKVTTKAKKNVFSSIKNKNILTAQGQRKLPDMFTQMALLKKKQRGNAIDERQPGLPCNEGVNELISSSSGRNEGTVSQAGASRKPQQLQESGNKKKTSCDSRFVTPSNTPSVSSSFRNIVLQNDSVGEDVSLTTPAMPASLIADTLQKAGKPPAKKRPYKDTDGNGTGRYMRTRSSSAPEVLIMRERARRSLEIGMGSVSIEQRKTRPRSKSMKMKETPSPGRVARSNSHCIDLESTPSLLGRPVMDDKGGSANRGQNITEGDVTDTSSAKRRWSAGETSGNSRQGKDRFLHTSTPGVRQSQRLRGRSVGSLPNRTEPEPHDKATRGRRRPISTETITEQKSKGPSAEEGPEVTEENNLALLRKRGSSDYQVGLTSKERNTDLDVFLGGMSAQVVDDEEDGSILKTPGRVKRSAAETLRRAISVTPGRRANVRIAPATPSNWGDRKTAHLDTDSTRASCPTFKTPILRPGETKKTKEIAPESVRMPPAKFRHDKDFIKDGGSETCMSEDMQQATWKLPANETTDMVIVDHHPKKAMQPKVRVISERCLLIEELCDEIPQSPRAEEAKPRDETQNPGQQLITMFLKKMHTANQQLSTNPPLKLTRHRTDSKPQAGISAGPETTQGPPATQEITLKVAQRDVDKGIPGSKDVPGKVSVSLVDSGEDADADIGQLIPADILSVGSPYASFPYLLCNEDEDADDEEEPVRLSQLSTTKAVEDALASLRQVASPEIVFHEVTLSDTEDDVEIIYLSPGLLSPGFPAISELSELSSLGSSAFTSPEACLLPVDQGSHLPGDSEQQMSSKSRSPPDLGLGVPDLQGCGDVKAAENKAEKAAPVEAPPQSGEGDGPQVLETDTCVIKDNTGNGPSSRNQPTGSLVTYITERPLDAEEGTSEKDDVEEDGDDLTDSGSVQADDVPAYQNLAVSFRQQQRARTLCDLFHNPPTVEETPRSASRRLVPSNPQPTPSNFMDLFSTTDSEFFF